MTLNADVQQALIQVGETILAENKVPDAAQNLSQTISNTGTGQNLLLLGMAAKNVVGLNKTLDFMANMESQLCAKEVVEGLNFDQRIVLYDQSRKSAKFRHDFLKSVQENVDVANLQVDLLQQNSKLKKDGALPKDIKKVVRETLTRKITNEYTLRGNSEEVKEVPLTDVSDYEEGEEE